MEKPSKLPKLVVFDLDYTLWPFWVDSNVDPPFNKINGRVVDARGKTVKHYADTPQILKTLYEWQVPVAVASRTSEIDGANELIRLFGWDEYFKYKEIYPGRKTAHFEKFREYSGVPYEEMLFFDDEERNIRDLSNWNVTCVLVRNGMTMAELTRGLELFSNLTLWDFRVDKLQFPFKKYESERITDDRGVACHLYSDTRQVLEYCLTLDLPVAVASRVATVAGAYQLLSFFGLWKYLSHVEVYPLNKNFHFKRFREYSRIPYKEMKFFDDENRIIRDVSKRNVTCALVKNGMTVDELDGET